MRSRMLLKKKRSKSELAPDSPHAQRLSEKPQSREKSAQDDKQTPDSAQQPGTPAKAPSSQHE